MRIQTERSNGRLEFHVEGITSWDGFEEICGLLIARLAGKLVSKNDGPDARVWHLSMPGISIVAVHDDMIGNFFFAEKSEDEPAAAELAKTLDQLLPPSA